MLGTLGFDIMSLLHHTADRSLQEGKCQQWGRGIAGEGHSRPWTLGRFRFLLFDEAGNVLARALGFSRGWSQVQGTTNCKTSKHPASSVQRPAFSEARRVVWCGAVVQKC